MAFGDCLLSNLHEGRFLNCSENKSSDNAFWVVLRDVAVMDLKAYAPNKIDSDIIISIYYDILKSNMDFLPDFICSIVPSVKQERFRVVNRNLFSSNAFHPDGIANIKGINAYRTLNLNRKGEKIVYQWVGEQK